MNRSPGEWTWPYTWGWPDRLQLLTGGNSINCQNVQVTLKPNILPCCLVPPCILCIMIGLLAAFKNLYRLNFIADTKRPLAQDFPVQFPGNNKTIEPKILATWRRDWEIRILWKWPRTWTSELWTMQVKETHGMLLNVTQRTKQGSEKGLK